MPYIEQELRAQLDPAINELRSVLARVNKLKRYGAVNYTITCLIDRLYGEDVFNYEAITKILGTLEAIKLEFYRRAAAPYENKKIKQNGDVF